MDDQLTSLYPVVSVNDVPATADFFVTHLGFSTSFESDWYVSLRCGRFELGILQWDHPSVPAAHRRPTTGLVLTLEVVDVDAVHDRLVTTGDLTVIQELRDEDFGQRHVILEGPEGILVDIVQPIDPSSEFAAGYSAAMAVDR